MGPGFDALGLALGMYLDVKLEKGDGLADGHPALVAFNAAGGEGPISVRSQIPMGRGLGFSGRGAGCGCARGARTATHVGRRQQPRRGDAGSGGRARRARGQRRRVAVRRCRRSLGRASGARAARSRAVDRRVGADRPHLHRGVARQAPPRRCRSRTRRSTWVAPLCLSPRLPPATWRRCARPPQTGSIRTSVSPPRPRAAERWKQPSMPAPGARGSQDRARRSPRWQRRHRPRRWRPHCPRRVRHAYSTSTTKAR